MIYEFRCERNKKHVFEKLVRLYKNRGESQQCPTCGGIANKLEIPTELPVALSKKMGSVFHGPVANESSTRGQKR